MAKDRTELRMETERAVWMSLLPSLARLGTAKMSVLMLVHVFSEGARERQEWSPAILPSDFSKGTGFSEETCRAAVAELIESGFLIRAGAKIETAHWHQYKLAYDALRGDAAKWLAATGGDPA